VPTPIDRNGVGLEPDLRKQDVDDMFVEDPGAVTPIFIPLRSAGDLYAAALSLGMPRTMPAYLPCSTSAWMFWPFACCVMVCSYAPDTTSTLPPMSACNARAPPGEILELDLEPPALNSRCARRSSAADSKKSVLPPTPIVSFGFSSVWAPARRGEDEKADRGREGREHATHGLIPPGTAVVVKLPHSVRGGALDASNDRPARAVTPPGLSLHIAAF